MTYLVVYIFPMIGFSGAKAVVEVAVQGGHCVSDLIAKCGGSSIDLIFRAQWVTVVSWLTYPVVYGFPMIGFSVAKAVVAILAIQAMQTCPAFPAIQVGYSVSDLISLWSWPACGRRPGTRKSPR